MSVESGSWLTRERAIRVAVVCGLVSLAILGYLLATASGTLDYKGRPIGTDFSQVWTAGRMVIDGRAADVWNWDAHRAVQEAFHGPGLKEWYGWHYPPPFLLIAAALAAMPYLLALFIWQASTLLPFAWLIRRVTGRREAWLFVLAAEALVRLLPQGWIKTLARVFRFGAWAALVLITVPFLVQHLRQGMYPALEHEWQQMGGVQTFSAYQSENLMAYSRSSSTVLTP